jgi:hypothetical protein
MTDAVQLSLEEEEADVDEEQPDATYNKASEDSGLDHSNNPTPLVIETSSHSLPAAEVTELNEEPTLVEDDEWLPRRVPVKKKKKKSQPVFNWDEPEPEAIVVET